MHDVAQEQTAQPEDGASNETFDAKTWKPRDGRYMPRVEEGDRAPAMPHREPGDDSDVIDSDDDLPTITVSDVEAIFAPLPPIDWLVPQLRITSGAPTVLAGPTYVAKTMFAQELGICVAAGKHALDVFQCKRGRVLHVDNEQGRRITFERYQRLARHRKLGADELRGYLSVALYPSVLLDHPRALDVYTRLFDGVALGILDSLRALTPSVEENSSFSRAALDMLSSVSDKTGCAFVLIDHERKKWPNETGTATGDSVRGSNAKVQGLQSLFLFSGKKNGPKYVTHDKERIYGVSADPFAFLVEDVAVDNDPRDGLRLVHLDGEQLRQIEADEEAELERSSPAAKRRALKVAEVQTDEGRHDRAVYDALVKGELCTRDLLDRVKAIGKCGQSAAQTAIARAELGGGIVWKAAPRNSRVYSLKGDG
jgi:hypothetical protein